MITSLADPSTVCVVLCMMYAVCGPSSGTKFGNSHRMVQLKMIWVSVSTSLEDREWIPITIYVRQSNDRIQREVGRICRAMLPVIRAKSTGQS